MVKQGIPIEIGILDSKPLSWYFLHFLQCSSFGSYIANILHLCSMPLQCYGLHQAGSRMAGDRRWWWGCSPAGWTSSPDLRNNHMKKTKEIKKNWPDLSLSHWQFLDGQHQSLSSYRAESKQMSSNKLPSNWVLTRLFWPIGPEEGVKCLLPCSPGLWQALGSAWTIGLVL